MKRVLLLLTVGALIAATVMVSTAGPANADVVLATLSNGGWWDFDFFNHILSSILRLFNFNSIIDTISDPIVSGPVDLIDINL